MPYESEYEQEADLGEVEAGEFESTDGEAEGAFGEAAEMDLAAELLEVASEPELDRFLGGLVKRATGALTGLARSPEGQQLVKLLRATAKKTLPGLGAALGSRVGGPAGARIGSQLAQQAGQLFGLELEGLSPEDQEFEIARRFVRCAGAAARQMARNATGSPLQALRAAAQHFAPGLLADAQEIAYAPGIPGYGVGIPAGHPGTPAYGYATAGAPCRCPYGNRRSGRWIMVRGRIVLL